MSVIHFDSRELSTFAAIAVKLELLSFSEALTLVCKIADANADAAEATYNRNPDAVEFAPVGFDQLEKAILDKLAKDDDLVQSHFGPLIYNCYSNGGKTTLDQETIDQIKTIESDCEKWQEAKRAELKRAEENAVAFDYAGMLATLDEKTIGQRCLDADCKRVIIAEFNVSENDPYTDYFASRTSRTVVIGFGRGKRESFKQLRKAAAGFKPTEHLAPGLGQFRCNVVFAEKCFTRQRCWYAGEIAPPQWFEDIGSGAEFDNEADALAFVAAAPKPENQKDGDIIQTFRWEISGSASDCEHRETYSMGRGNYVGNCNSGWSVSSRPVEFYTDENRELEFLEAETKPKAKAKRVKKPTPSPSIAPMRFCS